MQGSSPMSIGWPATMTNRVVPSGSGREASIWGTVRPSLSRAIAVARCRDSWNRSIS